MVNWYCFGDNKVIGFNCYRLLRWQERERGRFNCYLRQGSQSDDSLVLITLVTPPGLESEAQRLNSISVYTLWWLALPLFYGESMSVCLSLSAFCFKYVCDNRMLIARQVKLSNYSVYLNVYLWRFSRHQGKDELKESLCVGPTAPGFKCHVSFPAKTLPSFVNTSTAKDLINCMPSRYKSSKSLLSKFEWPS